jgi:hypothetical protein
MGNAAWLANGSQGNTMCSLIPLSRDTDLPDHELTQLFVSSIPEQLPPGFNISPLQPKLCCKIKTWLHNLPAPAQSPSPPHRSKLRTGKITSPSSATSSLTATPSSPTSRCGNANASSAPCFASAYRAADSARNTTHQRALLSCLAQCAPPSMQWLQPSGLTTVSAPPTTQSLTPRVHSTPTAEGIHQPRPSYNPTKSTQSERALSHHHHQ